MSEQSQLLADIREHEDFLGDSRDVQAAEIRSRRFAQAESADEPFPTPEEGNEAADALKELKDAVKAAEANKLNFTAPYRLTTKHANEQCTELLSQPKAAIEVLTKRALATKRAEEARVAAQERERKEGLERRAEEAAQKAQEAAEEAEEEPANAGAQQKAAEANQTAAQATQKQNVVGPRCGFAIVRVLSHIA